MNGIMFGRKLKAGCVGVVCAGVLSVIAAELPDEATAERLAREKLAGMTLEEKVSLCGLCATMYQNAIPHVGIEREWAFSDCGHCMKPEHNRDRWGYVEGVDDKSTSLPCISALAATWNPKLAARHGHVMGEQMRARGKDQMLGPGVNIMRNPLCGRNWEYMSEDPVVAARMVVPLIRAVQQHGIAATVKHFCLNSQELNRFDTCSTVGDRALHEIYLPAFEAAVREGGALSVMTAYNRYNGTFCSENAYLQKAVLREPSDDEPRDARPEARGADHDPEGRTDDADALCAKRDRVARHCRSGRMLRRNLLSDSQGVEAGGRAQRMAGSYGVHQE